MLYVLLSDIHANRTALKAVEEVVERLSHSENPRYWFLGDLLGYGPACEAYGCLEWLLDKSCCINRMDPKKKRWVPGNHDEWSVNHLGNVRREARISIYSQCQFFQQTASGRYLWKRFKEQIEIVRANECYSLGLEIFGDSANPDLALTFTHASVSKTNRRWDYLFPWQRTKLAANLHTLQEQISAATICLIYGHTHFPVLARMENDNFPKPISIRYNKPIELGKGAFVINPGSVGQPRDGDPRASFAILDTDAKTIEFRRVEYDIEAVVGKLREESNTSPDPGAYESLIRQLRLGDGGEERQHYHDKVYRQPVWDLEAVGGEDA